jgi:uncharacterized membrane protein YidH (DUF202 family)
MEEQTISLPQEQGLDLPDKEEKKKKKEKKKEEKEAKKDVTLIKIELALYRAQMAMVRTATTMTTFGFALYKLLEEQTKGGYERPALHVITPRTIGLTLFFAGFVGLSTYSVKHVVTLKKLNLLKPSFFYSGIMLMSYILMVLTLGLFVGILING